MKKNEFYEGMVTSLKFPNKGIVYVEDEDAYVQVKNTLPGQRVRFQLKKVKKKRPEGNLTEVLVPSEIERAVPPCPHFSECGGCAYQTLPYEEQKKRGFGFANPANHFYSFYDETKLVGFINLYEEKTEIFFGIGVNPDCCGEGYGQQMTKTACEISKELFGTKPLYLEVRTWNKRAVSCYQKAGFVIKGEPIRQTTSAGEGVFYHMVQENK